MSSVVERFWEKVKKSDGCWVWQGCISGSNGYGHFKHPDYTTRQAHRISWQMANGPIPMGLSVLHKCDNPPCVRPDHLFLGTQSDNMRDCVAKGRSVMPSPLTHYNRNKTHCKRGHPYDAENTLLLSRGERVCRLCKKLRIREPVIRRKQRTFNPC